RREILPEIESPSRRQVDGEAVVVVRDPQPRVAAAGMHHEPDLASLVYLRLEEMVPAAERAQLERRLLLQEPLQVRRPQLPVERPELLGRLARSNPGRDLPRNVACPFAPEALVHPLTVVRDTRLDSVQPTA